MSTDFSIKPVGAPVATPAAQPVSPAANNAVATELPPGQSVIVADPSAAALPVNDYVSHQVVLDRAAASIVYQVIDSRTDTVVEQFCLLYTSDAADDLLCVDLGGRRI